MNGNCVRNAEINKTTYKSEVYKMEETTSIMVKPLGDNSIEELTGVKSNGGDVVLVNLNRAALVINCGSSDDFIHGVDMCAGIKAAIWNETGITIVLSDRYTVVKYEPPIHKMAKMFFEDEKSYDNQWKGNYKPVIFTKTDLIKFLKEVGVAGGTEVVVEAVRNMKLRESRHESDMISLDEDKTTSIVEESFETNIPKTFSLKIPVTPDFIGDFKFEVRVEKPSERQDRDSKQKRIAVCCLNPLEIQRAAVKYVLDKLPENIPRLYGDMKITTREHW
jgi:hypothetical protein